MRVIPVGPGEAGQRADSFLKKVFPSAPLSFFYKALRNGVIKAGKRKLAPDDRLVQGEDLRCFLPDGVFETFARRKTPDRAVPEGEGLPDEWVLFEDASLMAVDKPAGLNVHPGDHATDEVSLIQRVQDRLRGKFDRPGFRPSLGHRLDRETSGVVLVGKDPKSLASLTESFRGRDAQKEYLAAVSGVPDGKSGEIDAPLLRVDEAQDEAKVRVDRSGKPALTEWTLVAASPDGKWSLLSCRPKTGHTHQIRVHLKHLGHPIVGDKSYGGRDANAAARKLGVRRQLLHAKSLTVPHPATGKPFRVNAPLPKDFRSFLSTAKIPFAK